MPKNRYIQYATALEPELRSQYAPQLKDEAETLLRVKYRDEIQDNKDVYDKIQKEISVVDEKISDIDKQLEKERDNLADARLGIDKKRIKDEIHKLNLTMEKEVKQREMLRTKVVKTDIQKRTTEKKLCTLKPTGVSSSAAASSSGAGKFKLKAKAKAIPRLKPITEDEE